jgi:GntR family transcriptional repressor for pyruvate dehydrogenase complex
VGEARRRRPDPVELPPVRRLAAARLSDELAERIRRFIISEDIAAGARLPPERELAERFGASRPTVSQALRSLSLMGLVEIRRGSGVYVVRRPEMMVTASLSLMLDLDQRSLADLMQLRLWLETLGAREAAARTPELTSAEAAALAGALAHLQEASGEPAAWIAADTVFHATVVRSAGNSYLGSIYEGVHTAVLSSEFRQWVDREQVPDWLRHTGPQQQLALHEPIAAAVLRRDPDAAARAVAAHHRVMLDHLAAQASASGH